MVECPKCGSKESHHFGTGIDTISIMNVMVLWVVHSHACENCNIYYRHYSIRQIDQGGLKG